jgi:hypothetical protein
MPRMTTPFPRRLRLAVQDNLQHLQSQLRHTDLDALARQTRFLRRAARKVPILQMVLALVALAAESVLSLERAAAVVSLAVGCS